MTQKLKDFVILPRKIRDDYIKGKLTKNQHDVLIWIFENTNPYKGFFLISYEGLIQDFRGKISYDNIRKIISSLRKTQHIHFLNHKGRKGSFPIYPINFLLTTGQIQTLDYLTEKEAITSQSQDIEQQETEPESNSTNTHHNPKEQKDVITKQFSMDKSNPQITTSYNDNETEISKKSNLNKSHKKIDVNTFMPHNHEEQICWQIAKALGETDMRFILSCLRKQEIGFNLIERAWGIQKEIPRDKIRDPRKYFNKLVRNLAENK